MAADCVLIHRDDYMAIMHMLKEEGERHLGVPGDDVQRNYFANSGRSRTAAKATAVYVADVMGRVLQESPNQVWFSVCRDTRDADELYPEEAARMAGSRKSVGGM
jgi:hypothetical protein